MNQNSTPNSASMKLQALTFQSFPNFPYLLIVLFTFLICFRISESKNLLRRGSSLSVDVLTSPDKTFTCGFYGLGENAYWFSIWFTHSVNRTVVWTANRDKPVYSRGSKVSLQKNGEMVIRNVDGTVIWSTNMTSPVADRAELLDTGNLVVKSRDDEILWQSFDFPTDTLLPNQHFERRHILISRSGRGSFASGYFSLYFNDQNVLKLRYNGDNISSVYWPNPNPDVNVFATGRTIYNNSAIAVFDETGGFLSSDGFKFSASDRGFGIKRRLVMDYDGNLRLYSLNTVTGLWTVSWIALSHQCDVHGTCGRNGICFYDPEPKCSCPPGYEETEPGNWNKGCKPKFNISCSNSQQLKFIQVPHLDFWGYDIGYNASTSEDDCMKSCLRDCQCQSYNYRLTGDGRCYTKNMLLNGGSSPDVGSIIHIKVPASFETPETTSLRGTTHVCRDSNVTIDFRYQSTHQKVKWIYLYVFACVIGVIEAVFLVSGCWLLFRRHGIPSLIEDGYRTLASQFRRFTYSELKKATKNFRHEVGRGGSAAVYKGVLEDERSVAVKKLGDLYQGEEVFWSEMSTIGNIYHINLVRMWGFCSEGRHRLLVYEYVENQSLDKHLFSSDFLGWKERFKVALGTARGLAYLHHECLEWVIHCDVKPENILLDSEFEPKIADFGLAKLSQRGKNSAQFSRIRGTKGYMAPEWAMNLPITAKVDVYSYGVVILELIKGIRLSNLMVRDGEEQEAELTRYVRMVKRKIQCAEEIWIEDVVDPRLNEQFNKNQVATLVEIGISCVEEDRNKRPTMDSVVQTLLQCEAKSELQYPNNP